MTDKEIFEKLEAEIERLENYENENVTSSDTRFGWIHGKTFALTSIRTLLDSMQEEPVSEDLNTVAKEYANNITEKIGYRLQLRRAVCFGAKWQKQKMLAKAVNVNISNASIVSLPSDCNLKVGDKVLIIKED